MINTLKKYSGIVLLTAVLVIAGLHFSSRVLTPKGEIEKFYDESRNSIDVLVVGSSHSMSGISPMQIYEETGLTAYNLSTWSQPVWVSYHYIVEALKYQQPQVIVLDVFGAFYEKSYLSGVDVDLVSDDYACLIKPSANLLRLNLARRSAQVTAKTWDEYLNITKYHSRLNRLEWEDIAVLFRNDRSTGKGYGPMYVWEDFSGHAPAVTDRREALYGPAAEYLQKIIDLTEEKGIRLVMTKVPYITEETDIALLNTVQGICDAQEIPFVDFCRQNIAAMDYAADMADHGHVNYRGAEKVTAVLSRYLMQEGIRPQHSPKAQALWQEELTEERNNLTKADIRVTAALDEKLNKAVQHENTAVIALVQGELDRAATEKLSGMLVGTVLEKCDGLLQHGACAVYDDALLQFQQAEQWLNGCRMQIHERNDGSLFVLYENREYSHRLTGLNLLLLDTQTGEIYQAVSYGMESDFTAYTG